MKYWREFFIHYKTAFAWTYSDLKGIPAEVCEHKIVLEDDAKPVRQRQHRLNPKYSLMVKEELDKLLEVGFIYPVPHNEWVFSHCDGSQEEWEDPDLSRFQETKCGYEERLFSATIHRHHIGCCSRS